MPELVPIPAQATALTPAEGAVEAGAEAAGLAGAAVAGAEAAGLAGAAEATGALAKTSGATEAVGGWGVAGLPQAARASETGITRSSIIFVRMGQTCARLGRGARRTIAVFTPADGFPSQRLDVAYALGVGAGQERCPWPRTEEVSGGFAGFDATAAA